MTTKALIEKYESTLKLYEIMKQKGDMSPILINAKVKLIKEFIEQLKNLNQ